MRVPHDRTQFPRPAGTPWFTGLLVSVFTAALVAAAVAAFGSQLARINWALACSLNLVAVAGIAPSVWRLRKESVWRWLVYGGTAGVVLGWAAVLIDAR